MGKVPESKKDVNRKIFTYLNLSDNENFQLLHNDVKNCYCFQLYGRFFGQKIGNIFKLNKVEFKIVHINIPKGFPYYKVKTANMKYSSNLNSSTDVDVNIIIEPLSEKHKGIDFVLENEFNIMSNGHLFDYHINTDPAAGNRNGRPCKNKIFF